MPVIGLYGTATNLADTQKPGAVLAWGSVLTYVVNFLIVAFVLFLMVRLIAMLRRTGTPALPLTPSPEEVLLTEIRDQLATSRS